MKELKIHPIFYADGKCKKGWQPKPEKIDFKKPVDIIGFSCGQCAVMSWRTEVVVSLSENPLSEKEGYNSLVWRAGLTPFNPSKDIVFPHPLKVGKLFIHYFTTQKGDCA